MSGLFSWRDLVALRRKVYLLLVVAGLIGMTGWVMTDAERMLGAAALPAAATVAAVQPLTTGSAMDGFGTWSADGRQIAFMRDGQLWLMNADGKGVRRLTNSENMWDAVPAWQPGGRELAFARVSMDGDGAFVMAIDPATGRERVLTTETEAVGHVAWDQSGKALFYTTPRRLMRLNLQNGKAQQIFSVADDWDMQAGGLAVTPDGGTVIFGAGPRVGRGYQYDLLEIRMSNLKAEPKRLTRGGGIMPALDRTGKLLAYRSPRQASGIYIMDRAADKTRQVVPDEGRALFFHPSFSPDGKRLLISRLLVGSTGGGPDGSRFTSHLYVHTLTPSGREH